MTRLFHDEVRLRDIPRLDVVTQGNFVAALVLLAITGFEIATGGLAFAALVLVVALFNLWIVDQKLREVSP